MKRLTNLLNKVRIRADQLIPPELSGGYLTMHKDMYNLVIHRWNQTDTARQQELMAAFIEINGNFHQQNDWLHFLAVHFNLSEYETLPLDSGYMEH